MENNKQAPEHGKGKNTKGISSKDRLMILIILIIIVLSAIALLVLYKRISETALLKFTAGIVAIDIISISVLLTRNSRMAKKAAKQRRKAYIVSKASPNIKMLVNKDIFTVGRQPEKADYCLDDLTVSKLHVEIRKIKSTYYISDLNSKNGTYLNGLKIKTGTKYRLKNGDTFVLGSCHFIFVIK